MEYNVLKKLLTIELFNIAANLQFIDEKPSNIEYDDLIKIVSTSEKLSRQGTIESKEKTILIIALCWEYCDDNYKSSLREIFILQLTRIGFSPSTILLDSNYAENKKYYAFNSYLNQLQVAISQQEHTVSIGDENYVLSNFQRNVWDASEKYKYVAISAPTSAGKSFVIYLRIIKDILSGFSRFVYIVPTISLINQVTKDLSLLLKKMQLSHIKVLNNLYDDDFDNKIYILTQERLISFFNKEDTNFTCEIIIIDEIQNIERVANDDSQRSKILYDVLKEIDRTDSVKQVILSGPGLRNIGDLSNSIFKGKCHVVEDIVPPVLNITYSISYHEKTAYLNQYTPFLDSHNRVLISNDSMLPPSKKVMYNDYFHDFLSNLIINIGRKPKNIIFSPTPDQARKTAIALFERDINNYDDVLINSLSDYIKDFVHTEYDLARTVTKKIAYHSGSLPLHIRSSIENAFVDGVIDNVVCTTTLMQGVNFPASNVIIRNPNLYIRRKSGIAQSKLSDYEFSNLRGRAGRLLKEFIGRTIVLDEPTFLSEENDNNFKNTIKTFEKEITVGYGSSYRASQTEIERILMTNNILIDGEYKHLLTYIRNTLYKNGMSGIKMLREVGINISSEVATHALHYISKLQSPRHYILNNRYWDPFDLELLFIEKNKDKFLTLPSTIWSKNLTSQLQSAILKMAKIFPYYFKKYISKEINEIFIYSVCINATKWCREIPLKDILEERDFSNSKDVSKSIDDAIKIITRTVSYGLPMFLKPLADLGDKENNILSHIENGTYTVVSKNLTNQGIPRDTAIYLNTQYIKNSPEFSMNQVIKKVQNDVHHNNYWILKQIEHLGN
ncbi:DEAD/DEAH box helicase [Serratia silvae]|uniref:DEAD/DEAH box helicase n=1 Tax=Serratia silvae TaxID=2824122 RepID=A0ABT0KCR0_9GAMM|nr:DEAD/DEAH box helicase [Serratia silvae]MCL1029810.1 DEAD/DEAH box helicase [Serratia silvae]